MYSERLTNGFEWASRLHAAQKRKGVDTPYLSHLLGVASLIIEFGGNEDAVISGLLHDAVEDCGGPLMLDQIRDEFDDIVADTVMACSDKALAEGEIEPEWEDRKRVYIAAVATKSELACFVTACDKLHNSTAILHDHILAEATGGEPVWNRFSGKTREQTVAYYSAMLAALTGRIPDPLTKRLNDTVAALVMLVDRDEHDSWVKRLAAAEEVLLG